MKTLILCLLFPFLTVAQTFELHNGTAQIITNESLPFATNEYSALFKFDSVDNPKLRELRDRYHLTNVIAAGKSEFEQQILLMDWVHNRFKKFGQPSIKVKGALEILQGIENNETFFCTQYAQLFVSAAASLGWVDRVLALRRHQDRPGTGSTEHSTTEIWSNQYRKWVMLDPTSNMFLEKNGIPLNAWEIRDEWFNYSGTNLTFVIGKEQKKYRKADLPIFLKRFPGFGDLAIDPYELDKYGFIGYIPNTDLMDSGFDYGNMFITKDHHCNGTTWHKRKNPKNPATEPYFPINQATLTLTEQSGHLVATLSTLTPNFSHFEVNRENEWFKTKETLQLLLKPGVNKFKFRSTNLFGSVGPDSVLTVTFKKD